MSDSSTNTWRGASEEPDPIAAAMGGHADHFHDAPPDPVSAVQRTVRILLRLSMQAKDGDYISSENELQQHCNVSRPTFRQAAKIVQNDKFIEIRRGINGGIFASRPAMRDVVQRPALFLRLSGADLTDAQEISRLMTQHIFPKAAALVTSQQRQKMLDHANRIHTILHNAVDVKNVVQEETILAELVAEVCDNPFFALYTAITNEFGNWEHSLLLYRDKPDRCRKWLELVAEMYCAMAAQDEKHCAELAAQRSDIVSVWIAEHGPSRAQENSIEV